MSVTTSCKTVTFSYAQFLALQRAIAWRDVYLAAQMEIGHRACEDSEMMAAFAVQMHANRSLRDLVNSTPFTEGAGIVASPKPIQLESQKQLFEVGCAMEEAIIVLEQRIRLFGPGECDTIENLTERLAAVKAAYDIVRRAF